MLKKVIFGLLAIVSFLTLTTVSREAEAQLAWTDDAPVVTRDGDQLGINLVPDPFGGMYVSWWDRRRQEIFVQHLNNAGTKLWSTPAKVADHKNYRFNPTLTSDGAGGVIIAWSEGRGGFCGPSFFAECDLYIQRLNPNGGRLWGVDGKLVSSAPHNQGIFGIEMISDRHGGAYLAWRDARNEVSDLFALRVDKNGQALWTAGGIRINTLDIEGRSRPRIELAGDGDVFIAWTDAETFTGPAILRLQHLNADGTRQLREGGMKVGTPSSVHFDMASDGLGGALLAIGVRAILPVITNIAVQRVSEDNRILWGTNGTRASDAEYYAGEVDVTSDGSGGAFVAWVDHRATAVFDESDIRAQHVSPAGNILWKQSGKGISKLQGQQDNVVLAPAGNGGALLVWRDCRGYLEQDECFRKSNIYGQRLYANGTSKWIDQGLPLIDAPGAQGMKQGTPSGASFIVLTPLKGGDIGMAWPDGRRTACLNYIGMTDCNIFAQRIEP